MKTFGINSQWSKKNAVAAVLPDDVTEEVKPILRLLESEKGDHIYKDLKEEILEQFGPRPNDVFKKAMALKLNGGRPSGLGKRLIHVICPGPKPMSTCHCANMIYECSSEIKNLRKRLQQGHVSKSL